MGRTTCTELQCLYKGALYLYLTVQLYLYSPYGPYDLYRASVPVQGCTLPLPNSTAIPLLPLWAVRPVQSLSACTRVHFTLTGEELKCALPEYKSEAVLGPLFGMWREDLHFFSDRHSFHTPALDDLHVFSDRHSFHTPALDEHLWES